jgi:hypothetical protein
MPEEKLRKQIVKLRKEIEILRDPKVGKLFKCGRGHRHFMFNCLGCQEELSEFAEITKKKAIGNFAEALKRKWRIDMAESEFKELIEKEKEKM